MSSTEKIEYDTEFDFEAAFDELALACGHEVLGRVTEMDITEDDFVGDSTLLRLSAANVKTGHFGKTIIVRPAMEHSEIVASVLKRTHSDVYGNPKGKKALDTLFAEYVQLGEFGADVTTELERNYEATINSEPPLPDLMRGMIAFKNAEFNHWGGAYESSLIRPASVMAAWIIAHERNEPLE